MPPVTRTLRCAMFTSSRQPVVGIVVSTRTYLIIPRVRDGAYMGAVLDGARRRVLYVHKASDGDECAHIGSVPSDRGQNGRARRVASLPAGLTAACTRPVLAST